MIAPRVDLDTRIHPVCEGNPESPVLTYGKACSQLLVDFTDPSFKQRAHEIQNGIGKRTVFLFIGILIRTTCCILNGFSRPGIFSFS
jgi:hypothetical protein